MRQAGHTDMSACRWLRSPGPQDKDEDFGLHTCHAGGNTGVQPLVPGQRPQTGLFQEAACTTTAFVPEN